MEELSIIIREAQSSDVEHLPNIERSAAQLFKQDSDLAWVADDSVLSAELHQSYIQAQNSWVAEYGDQLIGFINGVEYNNTFHICEFSVVQEWQQQGIGRALLTKLEEVMRDRKLSTISVTTFKDVPWNAPFYEQNGFIELKENDLSLFLMDILEEEIDAGFDPDTRCAMQKNL